jgi:HEAT repeat protein
VRTLGQPNAAWAGDRGEPDGAVRAAAIWALGQIGDPKARDAIVAGQHDADVSVRGAANVSARLLRL